MRNILLVVVLLLASCQSDKRKEYSNMMEVGGLILPDTLIVAEKIDEMQANGDGYLVYNYKIDRELLEDLKAQKNFVALPFERNEVVDNRIYDYMQDQDSGYYFVTRFDNDDPRDQLIILLNVSRMELTIMMVYV